VRITNGPALATTALRADALAIAEAGLDAIDAAAAVGRAVAWSPSRLRLGEREIPLRPSGRVLLVSVGKCGAAAARALGSMPGSRLDGGIVLDVEGGAGAPAGRSPLVWLAGTHPMPSPANVEATRRIVTLLEGAGADDLVLCVISGGGSTLLCLPPNDAPFEAERAMLEALFRAGATIQEINTVRKHSSLARGGQLARCAYPARVVSLIFSDVPGGAVDMIASGPTVRDPSGVADAEAVLRRYGLAGAGAAGGLALVETPKEARYFERVEHLVVVSNEVALRAMGAAAGERGYAPTLVTATLAGEAREVGLRVVRELEEAAPRSALLYGGETTVTVAGHGRGGRNLELALSALRAVGDERIVVTVASDGRDNGAFAGAVADAAARARGRELGVDPEAYLAANDSYPFFERTGDFLLTGPTGANVADLVIALRR
jgi:glycerate 2-kinase